MKLEDFVIKFFEDEMDDVDSYTDEDRVVFLGFDGEGGYVLPMDDEPVNLFEYTVMFATGLIYTSALHRGIIPEKEQVLEFAYELSRSMRDGNYEAFKTIEEMSLDEFNEEMKKYNGRDED